MPTMDNFNPQFTYNSETEKCHFDLRCTIDGQPAHLTGLLRVESSGAETQTELRNKQGNAVADLLEWMVCRA